MNREDLNSQVEHTGSHESEKEDKKKRLLLLLRAFLYSGILMSSFALPAIEHDKRNKTQTAFQKQRESQQCTLKQVIRKRIQAGLNNKTAFNIHLEAPITKKTTKEVVEEITRELQQKDTINKLDRVINLLDELENEVLKGSKKSPLEKLLDKLKIR